MPVGNILFVVSWLIFVGLVATLGIGRDGICAGVGVAATAYVLTGAYLATVSSGRLRLIVAWLPAFLSTRAYRWTCRGGEINGDWDGK